MGPKAMEMLRLIPGAKPLLTDRCSGHGGKWGISKQTFDTAVKVGRPAARAMAKNDPDYMVSECPLAGPHLKQVMERSRSEEHTYELQSLMRSSSAVFCLNKNKKITSQHT